MRKKTKKKLIIIGIIVILIVAFGSTFSNVLGKTVRNFVDTFISIGDDFGNGTKDTLTKEVENLESVYNAWKNSSNNEKSNQTVQISQSTRPNRLEIPQRVGNNQIVEYKGFTLSYNEKYEQPDWVAYTLTVDELNTNLVSRQEDFREDEKIITESAHLDDYRGSGYDRGHLCPSADRTSSAELNSETFLLSNMSPQDHRFNAGLWLKAEDSVRDTARKYKIAYVTTGPVFSSNMETIGSCNVAVPKSFYKVILVFDQNNDPHAIGMICPQEYSDGTLSKYVCTVNEVEEKTGLDFFPLLNDSIEEKIEGQKEKEIWSFY